MSFIHQNLGDNNCGAFAIAYWIWLVVSGRNPADGPQPNDMALVDSIYEDIQFGQHIVINEKIDFPAVFSDPAKMVKYLREECGRIRTELYSSDNTLINILLDRHYQFNIVNSLPTLSEGEFAILIVGSCSWCPTHYVLVQGLENGIRVYDPATGVPVDYNANINTLDVREIPDFEYYNFHTAIYIR